MASGELRWKAQAGDVITSSPVISSGVVCIQSGETQAFDLASGRLIWEARLGGAVQAVPVLTKDVIYLAGNDGEVYALE